ncbi:LuxR C-terminal-related transcriptional regulator [Streptomyces diastatochromogenes]|uniref:LuxR C-terminal-related transcriptional regulator n=1 Tax=Streptomyces diastatochromogenes TaxID=42236 RepID=UPI0036A5D90F
MVTPVNPPPQHRTSPPPPSEAVRARLLRLVYGDPRAVADAVPRLTVRQRTGLDPLPTEPAALAPELLHALRREIRALPDDTRHLLLLAAADQHPVAAHAYLRAVAAARLDTRPLEAAEAAGVAQATAGGVVFRDAWMRIAAYEAASPADRREAHRLLARVLGGGSETARRSWHRAAGALGPSRRLAAELRSAADRARAAGEPALAGVLAERAATLCPDPHEQSRLLARAATDAWHAGRPDRAHHLAARTDTPALDGILALRAGNAAEAFDTLLTTAVRQKHPSEAAELLTLAAEAAIYTGDLRRTQQACTLAHRLAVPPPGLLPALAAASEGDYETARDLLRETAGCCGLDGAAAWGGAGGDTASAGPEDSSSAGPARGAASHGSADEAGLPGPVGDPTPDRPGRDSIPGQRGEESALAGPGGDVVSGRGGRESVSGRRGGESGPAGPGGDAGSAGQGRESVPGRHRGESALPGPVGDRTPPRPGRDSPPRVPGDGSAVWVPGSSPTLLIHAGIAALMLGDHPRAATATLRAVASARAQGRPVIGVQALEFRVYADFWTGRTRAAEAAAREALRQAYATGQDNGACHLRAALAMFAAVTGDEEGCRAHAAAARAHALARGLGLPAALAQWALAFLDLATGRFPAAAARLRALAGFGPGHGHRAIRHLATPHYVEAAVRTGDTRVARAAHADYERWASTMGSPDDLALSARCRALLAPGTEAVEHYRTALDLHARGTRDLERARTELLCASALRRLRRRAEARDRLHSALEAFESFGAPHCAARARAELRALGTPVSAPVATDAAALLTAQQLTVARMAAEGATNREIADRLALSPRTIDHHLRGVFARLGIRSRIELVRLLDGPRGETTGDR